MQHVAGAVAKAALLQRLLPGTAERFCCRERIHRPFAIAAQPLAKPLRKQLYRPADSRDALSLRDDEADQHLPLILTQHPDAPAIFHGTLQKVVPAVQLSAQGGIAAAKVEVTVPEGFPCARLTPHRVGSAAQWSEGKAAVRTRKTKPTTTPLPPASGGESTGRFPEFCPGRNHPGSEPFSLPAPLPPSQLQLPVHFAFQRFPKESLPFQCHIAMCTPLLRDAHRTGGSGRDCPSPNSVHAGMWVWPCSRTSPGASGGRFFRLCT